ncbi:MAG: hypothetical protein QXI36_03825 [Candidatus Bathyarchaeia archaeon]
MRVFNVECRVVDLSLKLHPGRESVGLKLEGSSISPESICMI